MHKAVKLLLATLVTLLVSSCGGGGTSSPPAPATGAAAVSVNAFVTTRIPSSGIGVEHWASVVLTNLSGAPITNATVTINGSALAYAATGNQYSGLVTPDATGKLTLQVMTASGDLINASTGAITSLPVLSIPNPFNYTVSNVIAWNAPIGMGTSVVSPVYSMTLTNTVGTVSYGVVSGTAATFGSGSTSPGAYIAKLTVNSASWISGAAPNSLFWVNTQVQSNINII